MCNQHGLLRSLLSDTAWIALPGNTAVAEPVDNLPAVVTISTGVHAHSTGVHATGINCYSGATSSMGS